MTLPQAPRPPGRPGGAREDGEALHLLQALLRPGPDPKARGRLNPRLRPRSTSPPRLLHSVGEFRGEGGEQEGGGEGRGEGGRVRVTLARDSVRGRSRRTTTTTERSRRRQRLPAASSTTPPPPRRVRLGEEAGAGEGGGEGRAGEQVDEEEGGAREYDWEYYYNYEYYN